jgi:sugar phosphate isomerase/epimerase
MNLTRREFGKLAAAALPAASLMARPGSVFGGVRVGVITYSFRELPGSAEETLRYCLECGIDSIELMSPVAESYAGAPVQMRRPQQGRRRAQAQPEEARRNAAEALTNWRLSAAMDKYKAFRDMYEKAGVKIYAFKLPPNLRMPDAEYEYIWNVAETLGADHITMELPADDALLRRVADYAAKRKLAIAFHTHGQNGAADFDKALAASGYTMLNFDVGHYYGVNGESPVPLVEKYHRRIASLHLKDRKAPARGESGERNRGGANTPWGEGETPLKEILHLMKERQYRFPATIEYEYPTPEGSDVLTEVKKCVQFCKDALA